MESFFMANQATNLTFFVAFFELCFAIVMILGARDQTARNFAYVAIAACVWTAMMGLHIAYPAIGIEKGTAYYIDLLPKIMHSFGLVIGFLFLRFTISFPENRKVPLWVSVGGTLSILLVIVGLLFSDLFIGGRTELLGTIHLLGGNKWAWQLGSYILVYDILFNILFLGAIAVLIFKQTKLQDPEYRLQIKRMILPLIVAVSFPGLFDIILPLFGNFSFNWMAGVGQIFWVMVIGYAVIRHNQMKVKYVLTELLVLISLGLLFVNIFI